MPNSSILRSELDSFFGEPISKEIVKKNLSWIAGSLAMAVVVLLLFGLRNEDFGTEPLVTFDAIGNRKLENWYIASQLTLDSIFPVLYGWCFLILITTFVSAEYQDTGKRLLFALIATDYVENLLEVFYLSCLRVELLAWIANFASALKWKLLCTLSIVITFRLLGRFIIRLWYVRDGKLMRAICVSFDRITRLRFPLLAIGFFTFWGYFAVRTPGVQSIAANMLLLDSYEQIGLLACINSLAIIFAVAMLRAVWHHIEIDHNKNEDVKSGAWLGWHFLLVFVLNSLTPMTAYH